MLDPTDVERIRAIQARRVSRFVSRPEKVTVMKKVMKSTFHKLGYEIKRRSPVQSFPVRQESKADPEIPDARFYNPLYSPWLGFGDFARFYEIARPHTLVSADRCYVLYTLARQALNLGGELWECGVYKGGTARLLSEVIATWSPAPGSARLRLFDTFEGMPETNPEKDLHRRGDFSDTSIAAVEQGLRGADHVSIHAGYIPATFAGLEASEIAFGHIDVDIYDSIINCCEFIYGRMLAGGFMIFDDYGFPTCPGARQAVDEFFRDKRERPLVMPTGQAIVFIMGEHQSGPRMPRLTVGVTGEREC